MIATTPTRHVWKEGEVCNFITARGNTKQGRRFTAINGVIQQIDGEVALVKLIGLEKPRRVALELLYRDGERPVVGTVITDFLNWTIHKDLNLSTRRRGQRRNQRRMRKEVMRP